MEKVMNTYFFVIEMNGPISVAVEATGMDSAYEQFCREHPDEYLKDGRMDAEFILDFCAEDMSLEEFSDALESYGCKFVETVLDSEHCTWWVFKNG